MESDENLQIHCKFLRIDSRWQKGGMKNTSVSVVQSTSIH